MTSGDSFDRARELFGRTIELPADEREEFLRRECAGDEALRREVLSLLDADRGAQGFLEQPAVAPGGAGTARVGDKIGSYTLQEVLAAGGMGVVYRAEQDQPKRSVALKLIRGDLVSSKLLRRFELEAEALGRLAHPGIAQIFEAATTDAPEGVQPYFAMELIDGLPLTRHAARHDLRLRQKVALMIKVCDAVHHAHQHGIIHRDLKPANILVRADGQPKVLDFGVARVTDADVQATTMHTDLGQVIGTLSYMSPEQVRGRHEDLDVRSDVYALGVVTYELLTGRLPQQLQGKSVGQAARVIEEDDPSTLGATGTSYPADLETIVGKCLEKEKDRRYGSAAELAAELRRFLNDEPITARPPSVAYQFRKFARRNRALVGGAGLALAALVIGLVVAVSGWASAARARAAAVIEADKATILNDFLVGMLAAPDPWADGREVKVIEILDEAAATVDDRLADQPEVAATAHTTLGTTYLGLQIWDRAEHHYARALELTESFAGADDVRLIRPLRDLATFYLDDGRPDEAEPLSERIRVILEQVDARAPEALDGLHLLASAHEAKGELEPAAALYRQVLDGSREVLGPDDDATLSTQVSLGIVLMQLERLEEARPLLEDGYDRRLRLRGPDHPTTLIALNNLAFAYKGLGEHERALEMFRRSLEARVRIHGEEAASTMIGHHNLALQLGEMGRGEEALPHHQSAIGICLEQFGEKSWRTQQARAAYGGTLVRLGRLDDAEGVLLEAHRRMASILGDEHWRTRNLAADLASLYDARGQAAAAARFRALSEAAGPAG